MEEQKINNERDVEQLIADLCSITLTEEEDEPNFEKAVNYISQLTIKEKKTS